MKVKLLALIILLGSCTSLKISRKDNYAKLTWEIIENASIKNWPKEKLIAKIGKPHKVIKHPKKNNYIGWIFFQSNTGLQEWSFSINGQGSVEQVSYLPNDPYRLEFTIEKIMQRWSNFNCKHKKDKQVTSHVINSIKYLSCDNGKRIARYNMYNQIESISVKK